MQCKDALEQLNALADGEARGWNRVCLRRHVKGCPACAQSYQQIEAMNIRAQAWRDVAALPGLQARVQMALNEAPVRSSEVGDRIRPARPTFTRGLRAVTMIGAVSVVLGAFAFLHSDKQTGGPSQGMAFAAVRQAMRRVKTIHFHITVTASEGMTEGNNGFSAGPPTEYWVQLSPYVTACHEADGTQHLRTAKGDTIYHPQTGLVETDAYSPADKELLDFIIAPDPPSHTKAGVKSGAKQWESARVMQEGRELTRFVSREVTPLAGEPPHDLLSEYTVLADPQTNLVVRSDLKLTDRAEGKPTGWIKMTLYDFHYNETPPGGTFDLRPPTTRR